MAMADNKQSVIHHCREKAEKYLAEGNNARAFSHFLIQAKLSPNDQVLDGLVFSLRELGLSLEKSEKYTELFNCYEQAISIFPNSAEIQNNLGAHLFRLGNVEEAATYFLQALKLNPTFVAAKENLDNISNALIERWHFPMLNDKQRNEMYYVAIDNAVKKGYDAVLDIGTGTGILSMLAVKSGAKKCYACEMSKLMFEIAGNVLEKNQYQTKVSLFNKHSSELTTPQDLDERVSLVVTEILDSGLLGEGILTTLNHAWKYLLLPPENHVDRQCVKQHGKVIPSGAMIWATCIECDAIRQQNRILKPKVNGISLEFLFSQRAVDLLPYTTENLDAIAGDVQFLTHPKCVTFIDFNNPQEIDKCIAGLTINMDVDVVQGGELDAVVMWFNLHLDESRVLSTATKTCWEQAVYPLQSIKTIQLQKHSIVSLQAKIKEDSICFECLAANSTQIENSTDTTWNLNHQEILRINDDYYWQLVSDELKTIDLSGCQVLDLTTVPLGAIQAIKMQVEEVTVSENYDLIKAIAKYNNLDSNSIKYSNSEDTSTQNWDVILIDVVEPSGILRQDILETLALLRFSSSRKCKFIPNLVQIYAVPIESSSLMEMNRLTCDDKVLGFKISDCINKFKVTSHIDIALKQVPHKYLSQPMQLFNFDFTQDSDQFTNTSNIVDVQVTEDGKVQAVVFWFKLRYGETFLNTLDHNCFNKQACIVLDKPVYVKTGQKLTLKANCNHSCLAVTVE